MTAPKTRQPAGDNHPQPRQAAALTNGADPAQQARRAILWYLATGTPALHPGMPDATDIPDVDLWVILYGLVEEATEDRWDSVEAAARRLKACLASGDHRDQGWHERGLLDAIHTCAPDREAPDAGH